ncbi:glycosyltransferase family 2 protein [Helicobacter pullorum]|uniref:glycosyltransferase family 2 protein n=1 Tax=Helicobacter pullorum TaxID=35818 RepID=UPI0006CD45B8|nr:glycosyltransferase family 2 protein [Helicobacter pullorum]KPH53233.1 hypothetical protein HPU229254_01345 [Helicobacter pullorum]
MNYSKKIAVIVPIYNTSKYLRECLDSIVCQTYQNLEVVLVDDGSTEKECLEIAKEYVKRDFRFVLFVKDNGGQGSARNVGFEYCFGNYEFEYLCKSGNLNEYKIKSENLYRVNKAYSCNEIYLNSKVDYLMFVDSDDFLEVDCIWKCVENMGDSDVVWFDFRRFYDGVEGREEVTDMEQYGYKEIQRISAKEWLQRSKEIDKKSFAVGWGVMIDCAYLREINLRFLHCHGEDNHFGIMLFLQVKSIVIFPQKLYCYRIRANSTINYGGKTSIEAIPRRLRGILGDFCGNPMMLQKYYRAGGAAEMLEHIFKFADKSCDKETRSLLEVTFLNRLCMLAINLKSFFVDPLGYKKFLPRIEKYAKEHLIGAYMLVHSSLEYQLGSAIIAGFKSIGNFLKMPYVLFKIFKKYKKNVGIGESDLSLYWDYKEALRLKKHLSYRIGKKMVRILEFLLGVNGYRN